tara:strand:+ start:3221 stop:3895 length:675 start_codon:yes stop_codon:yes gene_type:complete
MSVAFCVPTTSRNRDWKTFEETYLNKILLPSISQDDITIYIGYDTDDDLFMEYKNRPAKFKNITLVWRAFHNYQGRPCHIWNELCAMAFNDTFDYVFVCGDDIALSENKDWMNIFIKALEKNKNIGYSAGWSNNDSIPTQFLLHKTHFQIFKWVFPPQITNYFCDDFLAELYGKHGNWFKDIHHLNLGGDPRYVPNNDRNLCTILVRKHRKQLYQFLNKNKYMD